MEQNDSVLSYSATCNLHVTTFRQLGELSATKSNAEGFQSGPCYNTAVKRFMDITTQLGICSYSMVAVTGSDERWRFYLAGINGSGVSVP